jgi:type I restriction enzyme M protein
VAVLVQFPGTLYREKAEQKIREYLIASNLVDTVIQLPPDWGYGVTAPGAIVILRNSKTDRDVLFVDASEACDRIGNKNEITKDHRNWIRDIVAKRESVEHFASRVSNKDIALEDCTLTVNRYVVPVDKRVAVDIRSVNAEIASIAGTQTELRHAIDEAVAEYEGAHS